MGGCTCPLDVWPARPNAVNQRPVFSPQQSYPGSEGFRIPCGQCFSCRLRKSQEIATRIMHEASLHDEKHFFTWTYNDASIPWDRSISKREVQLALKRFRNELGQYRYYVVGEYGGRTKRPHYHSIMFGLHVPDLEPYTTSKSGKPLYRSELVNRIWGKGNVDIGTVTRQSAGYCGAYTTKKLGGPKHPEAYIRTVPDPFTPGHEREVTVIPEFALSSRRPGLGSGWYDKFAGDCFPSDFLMENGRRIAVPNYYKKKLAKEEQDAISKKRKDAILSHPEENTERRLMTRHESARLRAAKLKRDLHEEPDW